jgi:alkylhydroperoxidase family enzyme
MLVDYALGLTRTPQSIRQEDIATLRAAGFSDTAIHDTACIVAYYNFVNRVASGLGVALESPD